MGDDLPDYSLGISILAQALASLTATVTATNLDIRALTEEDVAHEPIPYTSIQKSKSNPNSVANQDNVNLDFTKDDWGDGKDLYIKELLFNFDIPINAYYKSFHGFKIYVKGLANVDFIWLQTYHPRIYPAVRYDTNVDAGWLTITENVPASRIDVDDSLRMVIYNWCGQSIPASGIEVSLGGYVIDV